MPVEITMPKLGLTMEEGSVTQWLKKEGQPVKKGEPLLEVMTDKAAVEVEASADGTLSFVRPAIGETLPVGTLLAYLLQPGETPPQTGPASEPAVSTASPQAPTLVETPQANPTPTRAGDGRIFASPAARRVAQELSVDINLVQGSGPNGRIQEADVRAFAERQKAQKVPITPLAAKVAADRGVDVSQVAATGRKITLADVERVVGVGIMESAAPAASSAVFAEGEVLPLTRLRKTIGERMLQSVTTAPHFNISVEIDMTEVARLREKLLDTVEKATGNRLSYTAILVKVVAQALARHPMANSSFDNGQIRLHKEVNVGVAVAVEPGLLVPVIRSADKKNLIEISQALKDLQEKSRDLKFKPEELTGGTFTISNLGMFGIDEFTPIINPPETAILGLGQIADRPVAMNGEVVIRPIMKATLSADHRVLDGATAAPFLSDIKRTIENPYLLL